MEQFNSFTMPTINHHSFMRWNIGAKSAQKEKDVAPVFDPCSFEENAMEREFMVTALSA